MTQILYPEPKPPRRKDLSDQILRSLRTEPCATVSDIAKRTGLSEFRVSAALSQLFKKQQVTREGKGGREEPFRYSLSESPAG